GLRERHREVLLERAIRDREPRLRVEVARARLVPAGLAVAVLVLAPGLRERRHRLAHEPLVARLDGQLDPRRRAALLLKMAARPAERDRAIALDLHARAVDELDRTALRPQRLPRS